MSKPKQKQRDLSKQIWEAGVRVEIKEGMWVIWEDETYLYREIYGYVFMGVVKKTYKACFLYGLDQLVNIDEVIPILDFETAVEWLREKGWGLDNCYEDDYPHGKYYACFFNKNKDFNNVGKNGETPTETALECLLEVARRGK